MTLNRQRLQAAIEEVASFLGTVGSLPTSEIVPPNPSAVHIFESLTSTNQTAWELLADGAPPGTAVIAARQTGGRGQWGRQWVSEVGGLYLSLIVNPDTLVNLGAATNSSQLTMSIALSLAMCLRAYQVPVLLKWPNDLLLSERKLGGILTETRVHQSQLSKAVVGVGINWANPVPPTGINLQTFLASQINPQITSLEMLAAIVLVAIVSGEALIERENDMATWLPLYQNLLTSMGTAVTVALRQGVVVGVTTTGELKVLLSPPNGSAADGDGETGGDGEPGSEGALEPGSRGAGGRDRDCSCRVPTGDSPDVIAGEEIFLAPGTITLGYHQPPNIF